MSTWGAEVGRVTFDQAADDVLRDYRVNGKRTLGHVERRLRLHLLPCFGGRRLPAIDTATVRAYCDHRQTEGAANGTINGSSRSSSGPFGSRSRWDW